MIYPTQFLNREASMASTMAISFTLLPPTPLRHLTSKRLFPNPSPKTKRLFPNPSPKTFPLFPPEFRQSRVFVAGARPIRCRGGDYVIYNESELRLREGRALQAKNDGERLVQSHKKLHKILKLLAYIMLFGSADCDQNSLVGERRRGLILQYMAYNNGGAIIPEKEYYGHLTRLLKEWHTDVEEQEQRSRELDFRRLSKMFSLMKKVFSWFRSCIRGFKDFFSYNGWSPPWFAIGLLLCVVGVLLCIFSILFFPLFLIWRCFFRRPGPPPSPSPIDPAVVKKLLPFINPSIVKKLLPIDPSVVKDLLQLSSFNLATVATQLKTLIPVMIMAAALGTGINLTAQ